MTEEKERAQEHNSLREEISELQSRLSSLEVGDALQGGMSGGSNGKICPAISAGTPPVYLEVRTSDPVSPVTGEMWLRTDLAEEE